jgi:hypothetical protein
MKTFLIVSQMVARCHHETESENNCAKVIKQLF